MARDVRIDNPILNSPFDAPSRHHKFDDDGITDEIAEFRRPSSYFVPIPAAKRKGGQRAFDTEWTADRVEPNPTINRIRERVDLWRRGGWLHVTPTTRRLLEYWSDPERERRLFFAQIEALETAIYITEVATKVGDAWIPNLLAEEAANANPGVHRVAHKMATGSGKTVVMGMLIAWHTLNKAASPQDARFTDRFLIVTPGITIRDRLRVVLPSDPNNYYRVMDLTPPELREHLGRARIVITNFHAFQQRAKQQLSKVHKALLPEGAFVESPDEMVRRVTRELGTSSKQIVVINDEAHHCYRSKPDPVPDEPKLVGDDRKEAETREKEARVWLSGLEAVQAKLGIKTVYDLSATPFFLRGSGYSEGTLFPWVVSDFSLIDAIEAGVVKVPRVPVSDDQMAGDGVAYRDLWVRIRDQLPTKGRKASDAEGDVLPPELEGALHSLYSDYGKAYRRWEDSAVRNHDGSTPPVFIVVCNNTSVSKMVYDWIAGRAVPGPDGGTVVQAGELPIFSNAERGAWIDRPNTILIDSKQLESGDAMSAEFKAAAAAEIEEFKREIRLRFPGRDPDEMTDEDLLREVMNTVGKPGRLGEQVKCVVSVSMLTEGWDANTVTHILGVRAFSTQLLCEQVIGRGLRRRAYTLNDEGRFDAEYAEVYGVPFSFIPAAGQTTDPKPGPMPTRVRALPDRADREIVFPRVIGYRYRLDGERLDADFAPEHHLTLAARDLPTKVEVAGIVGETATHTLDDIKQWRMQQVEFALARRLALRYFRTEDEADKPWLFPQLLRIVRQWIAECVHLADGAFPQLLRIGRYESDALDKIYRAVAGSEDGDLRIEAVVLPNDSVGTTSAVDFDTIKPVYATDPSKCHVTHVVADTESWEQKMAQVLETMPEVDRYVKNQGLGFAIPYTIDGQHRSYYPDFIAVLDDGLNLIVEVSGERKRDKEAKVDTTHSLWVPAINRHGGFGRWAFVEITDPWDAEGPIRGVLAGARGA